MPLRDAAVSRLQQAASWPDFAENRYTVLSEIGRGGMGTVYLARDDAFGREVAIKVSNALDVPELEARLRTEARVLAGLEHPGIVPIHDAGRLTDGRVFYVMKYVRGQLLLDHLGASASLAERLRVFERICEPVAFAHAHGVVHRDLKPANVMVGAFGEVLVMDWGVAKVVADDTSRDTPTVAPGGSGPADGFAPGQTEPGTVVGTPGYMAPEQASGDAPNTDHRADVYGLGAVLFTLLNGEAPQPDAAAAGARLRDRRSHVPRALQAICRKAMAPRPADRYSSVLDLAGDVAAFRTGEPVTACPERWHERAWRVANKYRGAILLVATYLLMRAAIALFLRR